MLLSCLNKTCWPCLLLVLLLLPAVSMAAPAMDSSHHQQQQACHACHTERLPSMQQSDKCQSCHDKVRDQADAVTSSPLRMVAAQEGGGNDAGASRLPPGMSVPMTYPGSRVGPEPNPMVRIPAGDFTMGSDTRLEDEGPQQQVHTGAYQIDMYEVTNLQYKQFIDATQRRSPRYFRNRTFPEGKADHPVTYVSWFDAEAYCHWAGKRLPTEIEWEKAARGDDARVYPWGNTFELHVANTPVRWAALRKEGFVGEGDTTPVGAFAAGRSPYGLYDMSGNVWEWVSDWYGPHPGNTSRSENYGEINKVLKGGSWWDCSFYKCGISAPTFNRSFFSPRVRNSSFGFRCGQDDQHEK